MLLLGWTVSLAPQGPDHLLGLEEQWWWPTTHCLAVPLTLSRTLGRFWEASPHERGHTGPEKEEATS